MDNVFSVLDNGVTPSKYLFNKEKSYYIRFKLKNENDWSSICLFTCEEKQISSKRR